MTRKQILTNIQNEFDIFQDFWSSKEWWAAVVILSYIYNCIQSMTDLPEVKKNWLQKIMEPEINKLIVDTINHEYIRTALKIRKILSAGNRYNDDEFLLLMSEHEELSLIKDYLAERNIKCPDIDLDNIEDEIKSIGKMKINHSEYNLALSQYRKNQPLPIVTCWT